ncbi:hypothetical protein LUZ60_009638 [Juncus effusus]|nr:hypothetical protein LUZ60_009638 [Juncus effusus]
MENCVDKPDFSEIVAKKSASTVYVRKFKHFTGKLCSEKKDQILATENETKSLGESQNSETFKDLSTQNEKPLSGFGIGIKRRRNGSNALRVKPNWPDSESNKEENENENSSGPSDSACVNDSHNDTNFSVSSNNGALKQVKKPENERNERVLQKGDSNSSSVNFSWHRSGNKRAKRSKDFKENSNSNGNFNQEEEVDENLEVNAARMLCSLFNKNSSNHSLSNPLNGSNGPGRVLRPVKREGFARKRRYFHEVSAKDFDPFCIVNQRIRVYWPLDDCWYIGSVKEYDPLTRLHFVRYDDNEEEWLNLLNERFKLLLFPSEIPNKFKFQNSNLNLKHNYVEESVSDSDGSVGSSVESEPIVSFLTRSSCQSKPVPSSSNNNKSNNKNDNNKDNNKDEMKYNKSPVKDRKFSIVYSRKRFRNKRENPNPNTASLSNFVNNVVPTVSKTLIVPINGKATLKLNLPIEFLAGRVLIGVHLFWYFHSLFLLFNGGLISVWPVVKLEIIVSDNKFGSNYFLFEMSLKSAVSLFCLLVRVFQKGKFEVKESGKPVSWVKYSISDLSRNKGGVLNVVFFGFSGICDKKWIYLKERVRCEYSCLSMVELSKEDCSLQKVFSSKFLTQPLTDLPTFTGLNPMICYIQTKTPSKKFPQIKNPHSISSPFLNNLNQITHVIALPAPIQISNSSSNSLVHISTPKAPRTTPNRARISSFSKLWPDSNPSRSSKKPRTDNSYSFLPQKTLPISKIMKINTNNTTTTATNNTNNNISDESSLVTCYANLLTTSENKGWRESGAEITIDTDDRLNKWKLSVQINGETKHTYCPTQVLQPGSANRFTHAMMWRAVSAWSLEFYDRNQWVLFKQMYDKCYNKNMRTLSVKNIPIPGVRLVQELNAPNSIAPFIRGLRYIKYEESEIDKALDVSRVLYEMDSEDEEWVSDLEEIGLTVEIFEKVMDKCEKIAYVNRCEEFEDEQIEVLTGFDVGPEEVVKEVYEYWLAKRREKGVALIRQLQPPLWKQYEKLVEEWESSRGSRRAAERPAMFAFCLKPRGLVVNEGMRLRSHKRLPSSTPNSRTCWRSPDVSRPAKKKLKAVHQPRENPTKTGIPIPSYENRRILPSLSNSQTRITIRHSRNPDADVANPVRMPPPDSFWLLKEDKDEFRLRDASNSVQHLAAMARLKREKAQLLMHRADLALHKARVSLMIADALKASQVGGGNEDS